MLATLIPLLGLLALVSCKIGCKGLTGSKVDWFVVYKLPVGVKDANQGKAFLYADSKNPNWTVSKKAIGDDSVAVGATIAQIYKKEMTAFHLMYSDDSADGKVESYRGHAKGVLLFDSSTGFWIVHSAPNFPPSGPSYSYPDTASKFAQSFLCVTLPSEALSDVAEHLRYIQATPYSNNLPPAFATKYPSLRNVIAKQSLSKADTVFTRSRHLRTTEGTVIHSFAKHKKFHKDLWLDVVAAEMGTSLAVQSWLNGGADDLHSNCGGKNNVYDMRTVSVPSLTFNSSKDHSKWAVADQERLPLVCVGDLNRQKSQLARGGGALCIQNVGLWKTYRSTVSIVEPCSASGKDNWNYPCFLYLAVLVLLSQIM